MRLTQFQYHILQQLLPRPAAQRLRTLPPIAILARIHGRRLTKHRFAIIPNDAADERSQKLLGLELQVLGRQTFGIHGEV